MSSSDAPDHGILIVGTGHGGTSAAIALRKSGYEGAIRMVGREIYLPYERPPLTKDYLLGKRSADQMLIRPEAFWKERGIELILGQEVVRLNPGRHLAQTRDGARLSYDSLIWAAGGSPRRLTVPGSDLAGIHYIRSRADIDTLRSQLAHATSVVIIGAGYIGLETAAALVERGLSVTVLESAPRVLSRSCGAPLATFLEHLHRSHGVQLLTSAQVVEIIDRHGRVHEVHLANGDVIPTDLLIVGVGIEPEIQPLVNAGAETGDGVMVDEFCRSSMPDVFAIGDCATFRSPYLDGDYVRLESVQNSSDQAATAAHAIVGSEKPYRAVPWFWSNQYGHRIQTVGLSRGFDTLTVQGEPDSGEFSVFYFRKGHRVAADCVNRNADALATRRGLETFASNLSNEDGL